MSEPLPTQGAQTAPPFAEKTVVCPACGGPAVYAVRNAHRPFCSQRCKLGDLGRWANEEFSVGTPPPDDASEQ